MKKKPHFQRMLEKAREEDHKSLKSEKPLYQRILDKAQADFLHEEGLKVGDCYVIWSVLTFLIFLTQVDSLLLNVIHYSRSIIKVNREAMSSKREQSCPR